MSLSLRLWSGRRSFLSGLLLLGLLLAACDSQKIIEFSRPDREATTAVSATSPPALQPGPATMQPTPTLDSFLITEAANSPTPSQTPTITPTPTETPVPAERLDLGRSALRNEDFDVAAEHLSAVLSQPAALAPDEALTLRLQLGLAHLGNAEYEAALAAFDAYLNQAAADDTLTIDPAVHFHQAEAYAGLNNCSAAITGYQTYLAAHPDTAAYIQPRIAQCRLAQDDRPGAIAAYMAALDASAHRLTRVDLTYQLAELYLAVEDYTAAAAQYDAIHGLAQTETTRGQVSYRAGNALALAGDETGAHERYLRAVNDYPRAYESYLSLVELIDAGVAVDEFQRGLVDYYAGAYQPAVDAFSRLIAANPDSYRGDTHLYLAWSYEGLGNLTSALAQIDAYEATARVEGSGIDPVIVATAQIRRGELLARANQGEAAAGAYLQFVADFPDHPDAPEMAYRAARLAGFAGDDATAATRYRSLATAYPNAERAPEALFKAGLAAWQNDDLAAALADWEQLTGAYPHSEYRAAALIWLMRNATAAEAAVYREQAAALTGTSYYNLRARDVARDRPPFMPADSLALTLDGAAQSEAETWLRGWLGVDATVDVATLDPTLAADGRLVLGQKLWDLGLFNEAKRELEAVRSAAADSALFSYQLALYFSEMGLYRSSIMAAASLLALSPDDLFTAPPFISHLLYPVHYDDLILPLAESYGYDPLLQFALVRQESLFESFAVSTAAAKGLSQVIPDTGAYIAQRLNWPEYEDGHLYRPAVGLTFGAYYLDQQLDGFDGNVYAALAAYNGGPGNAARWLAAAPDNPDLFLETVNFAETRLYIQRIYVGHVIYRTLYGR